MHTLTVNNPIQKESLLASPLVGSTIPHGESLRLWHATAHSNSFTREETRQRMREKLEQKKQRERTKSKRLEAKM